MTWLLSFAAVKQNNPDAQLFLHLFASLNPDEILTEFLKAGIDSDTSQFELLKTTIADPFKFNKALAELEQFSLISWSQDRQIISILRLIQAVLQDNMDLQDRMDFMEIELIWNAFPDFDEMNRQKCRHFENQVVGPLSRIKTI